MTTGSLTKSSPRMLQYHIDDHDRISKLPDVLLQMIVSKLSPDEAVRTSVINDYRGHLESCIVHHYVSQLKNGTLQKWIYSLTRLKHTKDLALINYIPATRRYNEAYFLSLLPDTFSHHSLSSLSLCGYTLIGPHAFSKCKNLKTLKLINIFISQASVLSGFLAAFPFLEVILLNVNFLTPHGVLKIENNSLKFLQLSSPNDIDRMEVYATCLYVLDIDSRFINAMRDNFILVAPNIQVNKNAWLDHIDCPHLYYNVSSNPAHEEKNICHELLENNFDDMRRSDCLSVSVDITDPKEMEILKEKNKATREKGETSTSNRTHEKPFPKTGLCIYNVRLYNFDGSKEEEFAVIKMMIETSLFPPTKKFNAEASVAKLMELPKCNKHLKIECF
ncbi:hypothetical protein Bca52824_026879 [Brassica carinata]|uniref:FBD domain-containing protein n=1 Tax=Brassica carinata TaxID=52824 RepID=A0A8X7VAD4_BRACI|nr:hypothetical protein Bca52824_026879 [Brassica carinata]